MTKQEKIQEAYGEHWENVKNFVDENGWMDLTFAISAQIGVIGSFTYQFNEFKNGNPTRVRILSLAELEDNNGWIKIESEEDFPKENGDYFICVDGVQPNNNIMHLYQLISHCRDGLISHYKPVIKPNEPIY
jgi:hypothetical protein